MVLAAVDSCASAEPDRTVQALSGQQSAPPFNAGCYMTECRQNVLSGMSQGRQSGQPAPLLERDMKPHYFNQENADTDDAALGMAKMQGYVPEGCLLGGMVVMSEVTNGRNPCYGCEGPRNKCGGKPKK